MSHGENVLVTGGAGYLGSVLVPQLLAAGLRVTVLDNFMYGQNSLADVCHHPGFEVVRGDLRDERALLSLMKRVDIVIPLAALVGAPLCARDPQTAATVNLSAALFLLRSASPAQRILMPITNSAYGTWNGETPCDERSPLKPLSLYSQHKVEVERALMERESSISFRLATVFGMSPRMRIDLLVNDFVYRALHDRFIVLFEPRFRRNFLHVRDVARAFLFGIEHFDRMRGEVYNVGLSDANLSKRELCEAIRAHIPSFIIQEAEYEKDPDQRDYVVSNEKIARAGFRTAYSLDDGIRELIKGYTILRNTRYGNV